MRLCPLQKLFTKYYGKMLNLRKDLNVLKKYWSDEYKF